MLISILGARLSWHFAKRLGLEPAIVEPDSVEYSLKDGVNEDSSGKAEDFESLVQPWGTNSGPSRSRREADLAATGVVGSPGGTQSYAFVVHDPDAPLTYGFTHWVLYSIPASTTGIAEGGGDGFVQGLNDWGGREYVPPAPPPGHGDHFYYFNLYALDKNLDLPPGLSRAELLEPIDDHIIEQARIVGTYSNLTRQAWHH
jgi:Raf kinase inhibitor-like YbhB/YbcL family protein